MEKELRYLGHALESPERPFVAILGGAKVSDKIEVIENLLGKVDRLLIGGAMAYTFFKSRGVATGRSLVEDDKLDEARSIEAHAKTRNVRLELPVDHVVADRVDAGAAHEVLDVGDARIGDRLGLDIGPATIRNYEGAAGRREDGDLERADGCVRDRRVRHRHQRRGARGREREGHDDRRRRRLDCRPQEGRYGRPRHPHLDRRRRVARVPRRPDAARGRGADRRCRGWMGRKAGWAGRRSCPAFPPFRLPADKVHDENSPDRWQLEDVQDRAGSGRSSSRSCGTLVKDVTDVEIVVAPPFTALHAVAEAARNTNIGVSAQDVYWEREGAFTGEISPVMIKEAGAEYVIVGHSERRRLFGESDQIVNRKAMAALAAELMPIVCIGETLEERERNETFAVLDRQIKEGLKRTGADALLSRTSRSGRSAPAGTPRPPRPARRTRTFAGGSASGLAQRRPIGAT